MFEYDVQVNGIKSKGFQTFAVVFFAAIILGGGFLLWHFWPDHDIGRAETLTDPRFVGKWVVSYNRDEPQVSMWELQPTGTGTIDGTLWSQSFRFEEVSWWIKEPSELCASWIFHLENGEAIDQGACWPYTFIDENMVELQDLNDLRHIMKRAPESENNSEPVASIARFRGTTVSDNSAVGAIIDYLDW